MASSSDTLPAGVSSLCRRTDRLLWEAYERSEGESAKTDRCRLLFPRYRKKEECTKGKLRVSEQGARFAFVEALCTGGQFLYSVETPTDKLYQFTGETKKISAQTDLTVYDKDKSRLCNVEFKKGGWSMKGREPDGSGESSKSNVFPIHKDVLKLMREPVWGLWFHLLESTDNSTVTDFLGVIREGIGEVRDGKYKRDIGTKGLTIHVCVLKHGFSLQKDVPLDDLDDFTLKRHLDVDVHVSREKLLKVERLNGWKLNERSPKG